MKLSAIKKNPQNPRIIKDVQFSRLKKSIEDFPQMMTLRPIVVDESGTVLGGNMRLEALKALGYKDIPDEWVKRADELSEEQKREFAIKDNSGFGEWDWDAIANEWSDLPLADWGLDVPDTSAPIEEDEAAVSEMVDRAAELQEKWQTERGQVWQIGRHRLLCGDSTASGDVSRLMDGARASLLATDPPYNVSIDYGENVDDNKAEEVYEAFSRGWFGLWASFSDRQAVTPAFANLWAWCRYFDKPRHIGAWTKTNSMTRGTVSRFACFEPVVFYGEGWKRERANDVFDFPVSAQSMPGGETLTPLHPCPKPVEMWLDLLTSYTDEGEVLADAFVGSGTAFVVAEKANRICYGMEIEPKYCAVTLERMSALGLAPELLSNVEENVEQCQTATI